MASRRRAKAAPRAIMRSRGVGKATNVVVEDPVVESKDSHRANMGALERAKDLVPRSKRIIGVTMGGDRGNIGATRAPMRAHVSHKESRQASMRACRGVMDPSRRPLDVLPRAKDILRGGEGARLA